MIKSKHQKLLKAMGLIMVDIGTIWIMTVLCVIKVAFFPWCISYLLLTVGLIHVSVLFYRALLRELNPSFAFKLLASSGLLWGFTVAMTLFTIVFPFPAFYHGMVLVGIAIYTCYNLIMLRRFSKDSVEKPPDSPLVKEPMENATIAAGPDTAVLVLNLGENMISLRPYLTAEDYGQLEESYWSTVNCVKEIPKIGPTGPQDLVEIEKRVMSKLSEINGQIKLIADAPGEQQRVLLTGVITSLEIVKNFALNIQRMRNNK